MFGHGKKEKRAYLEAIIPTLEPMDVIGTSDLDLIYPLSWLSWITTRTTRSAYSHVLIVESGKTGKGLSTGASGFPAFRFGRVELLPYLMKQDRFIIRRVPTLTPIQKDAGTLYAQAEIGKKYPVFDPVAMLIQNLVAPGGYELKVDSPQKICSDGVAWFYRKMGRPLSPHLNLSTNMMTPADCLSDPEQITVAQWPKRPP